MATMNLAKVKEKRIARTIAMLGETPVGKWAVFRRSSRKASVRFTRLHDTREIAENEAKRLCAENVCDPEKGHVIYYVVFVETQFVKGEDA